MNKMKMTNQRRCFFGMIIVLLCFTGNTTSFANESTKLKKTLLFEKSVELPSSSIDANIIRVTFPPKFQTPWHEHKGPGPRYILKGQLTVTEGGKTNTYSAGDVFWESGLRMRVTNTGDSEAELIIFQLAPSQ
jgi:quercetin dioxygenase-like cupin family protein